jgi:hypothetical protein
MERVAMRALRNAKGQMRVIETLLASFIFVSALTFINIFAVLPSSPRYEASDLEIMGHNVLHDMDEQRLLSGFVYNQTKWEDLRLALTIFLPPDVYFNLTIYDVDHSRAGSIFYGSAEAFEASNPIASITYIVPGHQAQYNPRILLLQLVRG